MTTKTDLPPYITKEKLQAGIRKHVNNNNLEIIDIQVTQPDLKGAHFVSAVDKIVAKTRDTKTKKQETFHFFTKYVTPDESRRELSAHFNPTRKEVSFFNEILPMMRTFCEEELKNPEEKLLQHYPVCYYAAADDYDPIILEDLSKTGYLLNTPTKDQDEDHVLLTLKYMAEFHAVSHNFLRKKGQEAITKKFPFLNFVFFTPSLKPVFGGIIKSNMIAAVELVNESGRNQRFDIMEKKLDSIYDAFSEINLPEDPFTVINMGDCWNNNMMFKYDSKGKPIDIKFIDLQICRLDCMTYDLSYFIFTSTDQTKWKTELPRYLRHYYDNFTSTYLKFRGVEECPFTFKDFDALFQRRCPLAFGVMLSIFPIRMLTNAEFTDPNAANEGKEGNLMDEIGNAVITATKTPGLKDIFKSRILAAYDIAEPGVQALLKKY